MPKVMLIGWVTVFVEQPVGEIATVLIGRNNGADHLNLGLACAKELCL
jgi:hypothetical protein